MNEFEDDEDDDDRDDYYRGCVDDDNSQWSCVLGERCLVADPFHHSDECFDAEWAEAYFAEQATAGDDLAVLPSTPAVPEPSEAEDDILLS